MKLYLLPSLRLTGLLLVLLGLAYPLLIALAGTITPGAGNGATVHDQRQIVGYSQVGQLFNKPGYFWSRPSAVDYNAAASGGSNLGPTNPAYLRLVENRIHHLLAAHPGLQRKDIPADLVTASGSGLDPDLSVQAALIQVNRVAKARGIKPAIVRHLLDQHIQGPWLGLFGPSFVHLLSLNLALDQLPVSDQTKSSSQAPSFSSIQHIP